MWKTWERVYRIAVMRQEVGPRDSDLAFRCEPWVDIGLTRRLADRRTWRLFVFLQFLLFLPFGCKDRIYNSDDKSCKQPSACGKRGYNDCMLVNNAML